MINYQTDFYGWTQDQASLLKTGRLSELDIENLIEEVETMGRSEKRALESRLVVLLLGLLKWKYQSERKGRSWHLTIKEQRVRLFKALKTSPSLKNQLESVASDAYDVAIFKAAKETKLDITIFPDTCPWSVAQILDDNYYPNAE
jgi:hypothetical protein